MPTREQLKARRDPSAQKRTGAYYTPENVARMLVAWVLRAATDRLLDPACGDGRFLDFHTRSVGVEQDPEACARIHSSRPGSLIHQGDFFAWAEHTEERFECAAGNPPFIRYQRFAGEVRRSAQRICTRAGVAYSALSSSWAPFLVATATLLKPGGRMAFVVPAEIGHAPYAAPLVEFLLRRFESVRIVAVRERLFPDLSEDCWLLLADGFGGSATSVALSKVECLRSSSEVLAGGERIVIARWRQWGCRLRPFLLPPSARQLYSDASSAWGSKRLGDVARVGIGYVTGANDYFHLRPSEAKAHGIPPELLCPAVRSSRNLANGPVDRERVRTWLDADERVLLLRLQSRSELPAAVARYLDSEGGVEARRAYKCRNRDPWYVVPDVSAPDGFLSYMSGERPVMAANPAGCVASNAVHLLRLKGGMTMDRLTTLWNRPLTTLSCEIEGHPLGGGMLKLEPREAGRVLLGEAELDREEADVVANGVAQLKRWRHYGE